MPTEQAWHGIALTTEGHMHNVQVFARGEVNIRQMRRAIGARIADAYLTRAAARIRNQIGPALIGAIAAHAHDEQVAGQMHDRREIGARVEGHALHEGQPHGRQRELRNGIAIWPRAGDAGGGKRCPRARAIFRQHLHAKGAGCGFGKAAHLHISRPARRKGHQQRDRA